MPTLTIITTMLLLTGSSPVPLETLHPTPIFTYLGRAPGDRFGTAIAGVGDVDGDGVPDVAVGAPRWSGVAGESPSLGYVRVFSGRDGRALFTLEGSHVSDTFGFSVAGAGDLNGDGRPDLIVGAPAGDPPAGRVELRSGRDGTLLGTLVGQAPGDGFGFAVSGAGDVDGDGIQDVLVGAPRHDGAGTNAGRASVFSGAGGALLWSFDGEPFDQLGLAVAAAGDVNEDGFADVLIGSPFSDEGAFNAGSALLISPRGGQTLLRFDGGQVGELLGHALGRAGDTTGDGIEELWVGAPGADVGSIDCGRVALFSVRDGHEVFSLPGRVEGDGLFQAARVPDVDGDGVSDLAFGAASSGSDQRGSVRVLSVARRKCLASVEGGGRGAWLGARMADVGDLDGDGISDLAVGAPGHDDDPQIIGRVQIYSGRTLGRKAHPAPSPGAGLRPIGTRGSRRQP